MSEMERLRSCGQALVRDAAATAGVRVDVSEWIDAGAGIGAVVHEVGQRPESPVWDAHGLLLGGDSLAMHTTVRPSKQFPEMGSDAEITTSMADTVQMLVQILLWERGTDPTWPACPEHDGRHPLLARHARLPGQEAERVGYSHLSARWECPAGVTSIEIGTLEIAGN